jgi:hypothetical protein
MDLSRHLNRIRADLESLGSLADEASAEAAARIAGALEASLRLALLDVVTEAGAEVGAQLPSGRVEVRLEGGDPVLAYVEDPAAAAAPAREEGPDARITLRLPETLKASVERAAATEGQSTNAWLVQTIARSLEPRRQHGATRITGYARS